MAQVNELGRTILKEQLFDFRNYALRHPTKHPLVRDTSISGKIDTIVFHCTDAIGWKPEKLVRFFIEEKDYPTCGYHFYLYENKIFYVVDTNIITYHASIWNKQSVGFSIDYSASINEKLHIAPDNEVMVNAILLSAYLCIRYRLNPNKAIKGHRELYLTGWFKNKQDQVVLRKTCPGLTINLDTFRYHVIVKIQDILCEYFGYQMPIDGIIGPKTLDAINYCQFTDNL